MKAPPAVPRSGFSQDVDFNRTFGTSGDATRTRADVLWRFLRSPPSIHVFQRRLQREASTRTSCGVTTRSRRRPRQPPRTNSPSTRSLTNTSSCSSPPTRSRRPRACITRSRRYEFPATPLSPLRMAPFRPQVFKASRAHCRLHCQSSVCVAAGRSRRTGSSTPRRNSSNTGPTLTMATVGAWDVLTLPLEDDVARRIGSGWDKYSAHVGFDKTNPRAKWILATPGCWFR